MTTFEKYKQQRDEFLRDEQNRYLGADLTLNAKEERVNVILMRAKREEIDTGFTDPLNYAPARHLFEMLDTIKSSKVFKVIRLMPKGAVLHAHDTALLSTDKIVKLTYRDNLWVCGDIFTTVPKFRFSLEKPGAENGVAWVTIKSLREKHGAETFDKELRKLFTLYTKHPERDYSDIDAVWAKFMQLFGSLDPIVMNDEVWQEYYYESLEEFLDDNVQYLEFRGLLPPVSFELVFKPSPDLPSTHPYPT